MGGVGKQRHGFPVDFEHESVHYCIGSRVWETLKIFCMYNELAVIGYSIRPKTDLCSTNIAAEAK